MTNKDAIAALMKLGKEGIVTEETGWALDYAINAIDPWISVKDRLPKEKGAYIVAFHPVLWGNVSKEIHIGIDTFMGDIWDKRSYQRVTHWMPLPELPEKEA